MYGQKFLIFGGCVSRNSLEYATKDLTIIDYFARCSLASLYSIPHCSAELDKVPDNFSGRSILRDASKLFLEKFVHVNSYDVLLIDFISQRYDVLIFDDGSRLTYSSDLQRFIKSGVIAMESALRLREGSPEHLEFFRDGVNRFLVDLKRSGAYTRLRIIKAYWSRDYSNDCNSVVDLPKSKDATHYSEAFLERNNQILQGLYDQFEAEFGSSIFVNPDRLKLNPSHKWGPAPYHYDDLFYRSICDKLGLNCCSQG
jgi:hypothetical protein